MGDGGLVESEEGGTKGCGLLVMARPELRMDVDNGGGAGGGKQTGLQEQEDKIIDESG